MPIYRKVAVCTLVMLGGSACTALQGGPPNVFERPTDGLILSSAEAPSQALIRAGNLTERQKIISTGVVMTRDEIITYYVDLGAVDQKRFRNRVSDHYMELIDNNYDYYANRLFSEGMEQSLGFDAAIIGLAATASLFEEAADDLSTVISAYAGLQSAVDKNLYFDRTLPALITTMDAERTRVETEILSKRAMSTSDHTIEAAIRDLRRYQRAGTLMRAVSAVTENAGDNLTLAQTEYEASLPYSCENAEDLTDALTPLTDAILDTFNDAAGGDAIATQRARTIALLFNVQGLSRGVDELREDVLNAYDSNICNLQQINEMKQKITAATGVQI